MEDVIDVRMEVTPELIAAVNEPTAGLIVPGMTLQPPANGKPPRRDSFQCPACGESQCPSQGGARKSRYGLTRYRKCTACVHPFVTFERWAPGSSSAGCGVESVKR